MQNTMSAKVITTRSGEIVDDPPFAKFLFGITKIMAWVWLVVRVLIGLEWVNAASHKISSPGWMETGESLRMKHATDPVG